jgi:hypothetical protein
MFKSIFLVGYFCINSVCISVNQKHNNLDKCEKQGMELHLLMKEYDINKYRFSCVDATDYREF